MTYITRTPSRCIGCGQLLGQHHARGCVYARFTTVPHPHHGACNDQPT